MMEKAKANVYMVSPITSDFFKIVKKGEIDTTYYVDIAMKSCSCPDFTMRTAEEKKTECVFTRRHKKLDKNENR